ncbi:DNA polymerase eta isoform X2 [Ctenocephalides felis]|nr:DNA polymerase eta isoform X2 [Ctenocephalides felis]
MRGDEAQALCPDIALPRVPNKNQKADTTRYREAGKQVADVLQTFTPLLERASVDEAYLDITDNIKKWLSNEKGKVTEKHLFNTFAVGYETIQDFLENIYTEDETLTNEQSLKLAIGASIANDIRLAVLQKTGYECSAGIAHNKTLAKLVCGLNKPNKQTILPHDNIQDFYKTLPITKIRSLGGKFGEHVCSSLNIQYMSELFAYSEKQLQNRFSDKYGSWLYNIARGFDNEPVVQRLTAKSIGCSKNFPGRNSITTVTALRHWLHELANEVSERLEKDETENLRRAQQLIINFTLEINKRDTSNSRTTRLTSYDSDHIATQSIDVICNYSNLLDKNSEKFCYQ